MDQINQINSYSTFVTKTDRIDVKVTCRFYEWLSGYINGLMDVNQDLLIEDNEIFTASPGLGAVVKWQIFNMDLSYKLAKSWGQVSTHQQLVKLTVNYRPVKLIAVQLRGEHTMTKAPDASITDVMMSCNITF